MRICISLPASPREMRCVVLSVPYIALTDSAVSKALWEWETLHTLDTEPGALKCALRLLQDLKYDLPEDCYVISYNNNITTASLDFLLHSQTFDPVPEFGVVPIKLFNKRES